VENMLGNIHAAAVAGVDHGATGMLTTDWGDMGHHQQPVVSEPGLAAAAAFSWCAGAHRDMDLGVLAAMLDLHAFDDPAGALGGALVDLGRVPRLVTPQIPNMSALVFQLLLPQWRVGHGATRGLTTDDLDGVEATLDDVTTATVRAEPRRVDGGLLLDEVRATVGVLRLCAVTPGCGWPATAPWPRWDRPTGRPGRRARRGHLRAPPAVERALPTRRPRGQRGLARSPRCLLLDR